MSRIVLAVLGVVVLAALGLYGVSQGWFGRTETRGEVTEAARPDTEARRALQTAAASGVGASDAKQILFGDLHVHTTFSFDAFFLSLPMGNGEGAHPPADACDFARYCSQLDFWSINDHAEVLSPRHWKETVESIRQCNDVAGDPGDPDLVSFLGWEWTQIGLTPETHYGHKNVVLRGTDDASIPTRPISARARSQGVPLPIGPREILLMTAVGRDRRFQDLGRFVNEIRDIVDCPEDVPVRELPDDCQENASTPAELYSKLDDWGHDAVVIPHGTSWGLYTPPGSSWDNQLAPGMHDPRWERLLEVYSGHGNSEEYREFRAIEFDDEGQTQCPDPTDRFQPGCHRAGEIIRARCLEAGESESECDRRAARARTNYARAGIAGHRTVRGASVEDWLDAGQCRDCFLPALNMRPASSAQYITALGNWDAAEQVRRFRLGFLGSSDTHTARAGTGYKEFARGHMTDGPGPNSRGGLFGGSRPEPEPESVPFEVTRENFGLGLFEFEKQSSFFLTGGLVATHAEGRDRDSVYDALHRKEVYGTSGPRILLWFDVLNAPGGRLPMGAETRMSRAPRFEVRAVGAQVQKPGCPDWAHDALGEERLDRLCLGECYHPSGERRRITRLEIVRIRPQQSLVEPVSALIQDPWLVVECDPDPAGCRATFEDPDFVARGRETAYYVRAIQEPTPKVKGALLACDTDAAGSCIRTHPCRADRPADDDCLADVEERAWSSPIWLDWENPAVEMSPGMGLP